MKSFLRKSSPLLVHLPYSSSWLVPVVLWQLLAGGCSAPVARPTGPAKDYADAGDLFSKARYDRALGYTAGFVRGAPGEFNERGRVLRAVILSGEVNAYTELADAYQKGADATKNPQWKAEFTRLHHDNLRYDAERSLGLAEVAHALTQNGTLPKELTLEAPYPRVEGPMMVAQLTRVRDGGWIDAGDQESASIEAQRMAIENVLAQLTGGDRSQARAKLTAGPVKIDGVDFGLFLGQELLTAASSFDKKHLHDPGKMKALCSEAGAASKATATLLQASPDASKEKRLKKLQDDVKEATKGV
jgi:hypothetical protein